MEKWVRRPPPAQRGVRNSHHASFSSSLLDEIYRSIDESDSAAVQRNEGAPDRVTKLSMSPAGRKKQGGSAGAGAIDGGDWTSEWRERAVLRRKQERRPFASTTTSSSSDCSSYGGFSSSDTDSARPRPIRTGIPPVRSERARSRYDPPPPPPPEKKKTGSIRSRIRDLRKLKTPASPGARLASFLNSLFAAAGSPKKEKVAAAQPAAAAEESACSSASSYSRSCLSKTPSSAGACGGGGGKRSVRFCPVSVVVGEDCRPCGQKWIPHSDLSAHPPPAEKWAYSGVPAVQPAAKSWEWEGKKRVQAMAGEMEVEAEKDDDDDVASDASSDLFELEHLMAVGAYSDELPVYETTDLGTNRAIAQGLIL